MGMGGCCGGCGGEEPKDSNEQKQENEANKDRAPGSEQNNEEEVIAS